MFSLSPFSTFIPLSINMSLNWIQVHSSLQIWRRLLVYACSLSLHICYSYLNNILITYVNVTTTQPHPTPQKKYYVTCRSQDVHVYKPNRLILSKIIIYMSTCTLGKVWLSEPNQNQTL